MGKKIGRNEHCPCRSGKKFKDCCLNRQGAIPILPDELQKLLHRQEAQELIRKQQQGLGRPIISQIAEGKTWVAVVDTLYGSSKWKTVPDFLVDYLKLLLTAAWGNQELQKPFEQRHPILQWYEGYAQSQNAAPPNPQGLREIKANGYAHCFMGLAYNLYLIKHNAELQKRLIHRLKDVPDFQGAYYELIVANSLIRAGFELTLENEVDRKSRHCEFSAISPKTKKKYWVEIKMRAVSGLLGKTDENGATGKGNNPVSAFVTQLNDALDKPAADERLIFIDVNAAAYTQKEQMVWMDGATKKLRSREKTLNANESAYVFVTNFPFHRALTVEGSNVGIMAYGLGIPDFAKEGQYRLSELYRLEQKHIDAHDILAALSTYPSIPNTLDGSLPATSIGEANEPVHIGEMYLWGEEHLPGVLVDATVDQVNKQLCSLVRLATGENKLFQRPMGEAEFRDYQNHPDAFFGRIRPQMKKAETPYDLFKVVFMVHKHSSKEQILEIMKGAPDHHALQQLSFDDLLLELCERTVLNMKALKSHPSKST